jgi:predicted DCC family thiol-disulfide oxidoreductase YuxK
LSHWADRHVLAYDASCGPCSRFKAVVEFLDARKRIRFVALETADGSGLLDGLAPGLRFASFHLVPPAGARPGVGVWSGSEAILPLMRLLAPWGREVSRVVEAVPGAKLAVRASYSALSRLHRGCPAK